MATYFDPLLGGLCTIPVRAIYAAIGGKPVYTLSQSGVPVILSSQATAITATGAVSGATALPYTPSGVVRVYMFLGAAGGITGLYYARYSSTTAFQLYTDAAGTVTPAGLTVGAYVSATTQATLVTATVAANAMGANGALRIFTSIVQINNANSKLYKVFFGGTQTGADTVTAQNFFRRLSMLWNQGVATAQIASTSTLQEGGSGGLGVKGGGTSDRGTQLAIDTTSAQDLTITAALGAVTDYIILEGHAVEVHPG